MLFMNDSLTTEEQTKVTATRGFCKRNCLIEKVCLLTDELFDSTLWNCPKKKKRRCLAIS